MFPSGIKDKNMLIFHFSKVELVTGFIQSSARE